MIKRAIALVILPDRPGVGPGWLLVRRPPDDEDLPGVWGLPAGTFDGEETVEQLVRRIGRDKLGVDLEPGVFLVDGASERASGRPSYRLEMALWSARVASGAPSVPQQIAGVTQYVDARWGDPGDLLPGAREGSLCCRLGVSWSSRAD